MRLKFSKCKFEMSAFPFVTNWFLHPIAYLFLFNKPLYNLVAKTTPILFAQILWSEVWTGLSRMVLWLDLPEAIPVEAWLKLEGPGWPHSLVWQLVVAVRGLVERPRLERFISVLCDLHFSSRPGRTSSTWGQYTAWERATRPPDAWKSYRAPWKWHPISPNHMPFVKASHKACTLKTYFFRKYLAKYSWKHILTLSTLPRELLSGSTSLLCTFFYLLRCHGQVVSNISPLHDSGRLCKLPVAVCSLLF